MLNHTETLQAYEERDARTVASESEAIRRHRFSTDDSENPVGPPSWQDPRLRADHPKAIMADRPFWESLTDRQREFVQWRCREIAVACFPLLSPSQYVWLQKAANKIGGADADEKLLAEWALEGLQRHMDLEAEGEEIATPVTTTVAAPPSLDSLPLPF